MLFLSIFCRYKWYACRLTCTDKFPNVPTKLRKSIIGGGAVPPPPPSSGYASDIQPFKALSHWRRRRRDYRDWSVAATRATRETKNSLRSHQSGDVAATAPYLYIYLDLQLDLSFDDVNTRSVTWSLKWVKQRQAVSRRSRCNVSSVSSRSRRRRGDVSSVAGKISLCN